jgi:hypothetical protein
MAKLPRKTERYGAYFSWADEFGVDREEAAAALSEHEGIDGRLADGKVLLKGFYPQKLAEQVLAPLADAITEDKVASYLLASFVADALDMLSPDKRLKLAHLAEQSGSPISWQAEVAQRHNIDDQHVRDLYQVLRRRLAKPAALIFIMRGLCNSPPVDSLVEVLGDDFFEDE